MGVLVLLAILVNDPDRSPAHLAGQALQAAALMALLAVPFVWVALRRAKKAAASAGCSCKTGSRPGHATH